MTQTQPIDRERLVKVFFFVVLAWLLYQLFILARPFLTSLLAAGMLTLGFAPVHARVLRAVRNRSLAAAVSTLLVILVVVLPFAGFGWLMLQEAKGLGPVMREQVLRFQAFDGTGLGAGLPAPAAAVVERAVGFLESWNIHPRTMVLQNVDALSARLTGWGAAALRNVFLIFLNGFVLLVVLFFGLRDGQAAARWALSLVPMEQDLKRTLSQRAYETFWAVAMGVFITATAQGLAALVGYLIVGARLPVILGAATGFASLIGGSFLVTVPVALFVLRESTGQGVFLLLWGLLVVGLLDNVLKPVLIGSKARMPFVLIFFGIIGGLKAYGFLGFILGPILVAVALTFIRVYRERYIG